MFDFPGEAPIIRFLDTRGLGEVAYEPERGHRLLRGPLASDAGRRQGARCRAARGAARHPGGAERHPEWPVVVAQTSLHEAYAPGAGHVLPYAFGANAIERRRAGPPRPRTRASARALPGPARPRRAELRSHRLHASRRRLRARRLRPRCSDRCPDRCGTGRRGGGTRRAAADARTTARRQAQCPHPGLRAGRGRQRCLSPGRRRRRADGAGGHAAAAGQALRRQLGPARLCRVRRRARRRHAGAHGLHASGCASSSS